MHNDTVRPSAQWLGVWAVCARDLRKLDDIGSRSINGDAGGSWNPATPIVLGNFGFSSTSTATSIEGGVTTTLGGRMKLASTDSLLFSTARTHSIVLPLKPTRRKATTIPALAVSADPLGLKNVFSDPTNPFAVLPLTYHDVAIPNLNVHKGATLTSAVLTFRVGVSRSTLPANYPAFSVSLLDSTRVSPLYLRSGANGLSTLPTPANVDTYYALGAAQAITMVCDQNNTALDSEGSSVMLTIRDEFGANAVAGNIFHSLTLNFGAIADMHFE